ncbi:hypothetical protein Nepgr_000461 [Nepenthes gracilis]|uniref:FBD domain-containing protein n=1 Tax=Nepenthes gracilis TaxID=150966 RepID=A0AAD3RVG9_NEPGR|nr:hypothetical protein Nepgr_000461 [Nepenthes gracilis]
MMESSAVSITKMVNPKKRKDLEEDRGGIDILSDSVLIHILSLMPIKDAARMVLFPRLRQLWTHVHTLSFDHCSYHYREDSTDAPECKEKFLNFVHQVIILHESSTLEKFHLNIKFNLHYSKWYNPKYECYAKEEKKIANEIETWLLFATRKNVKVLDINLQGCGLFEPDYNYKLPIIALTNKHLVELKLVCCDIEPKRNLHLSSLRKLSLTNALLNDRILDDLLVGCPLLEELSLISCHDFHKLNIANPNVKKVVVEITHFDKDQRLEIHCPKITSFYLSGCVNGLDLVNITSLVYADICFSLHQLRPSENYAEVLMKLGNLKAFATSDDCVLTLAVWNRLCGTFNWKCLELKVELCKWHLPGISSLLKNSVCLETLYLYIQPLSDNFFRYAKFIRWLQACDFDGENYWKLGKDNFRCLTYHLKTVNIYGCITKPYVIQLIEFLLKNAAVLEKMVIDSKKKLPHSVNKDITSDELLEMSRKILSFPRASSQAVVHLC